MFWDAFTSLQWLISLFQRIYKIHYMKSSQPILQLRYFWEESFIHLVAIHWFNSSIADSYVSRSCREKLIEVSEEFCQEKLVSEPTRQRNILDSCFTSHPSAVISSQTSPGLSDNETCYQIHCLRKKSSRKVYLYNKASWDEIISNLIATCFRNIRGVARISQRGF